MKDPNKIYCVIGIRPVIKYWVPIYMSKERGNLEYPSTTCGCEIIWRLEWLWFLVGEDVCDRPPGKKEEETFSGLPDQPMPVV